MREGSPRAAGGSTKISPQPNYRSIVGRLRQGTADDGTWDGTRDIPREFLVQLAPGTHEIVFRVRDWRAAGGMVGPVYLAEDVNERVF